MKWKMYKNFSNFLFLCPIVSIALVDQNLCLNKNPIFYFFYSTICIFNLTKKTVVKNYYFNLNNKYS